MLKQVIIASLIGAGAAYAEPPIIDIYRPNAPSGVVDSVFNGHPIRLKNFGVEDVERAKEIGRELAQDPQTTGREAMEISYSKAKALYPGDVFFQKCLVQNAQLGWKEVRP